MEKKYLQECEEGYTFATVMEEAQRCLLCHDAPCTKSCPAGTDPGKFIRSIRFRNFKGAAETIRENNPLGGICARVCPTEKYCELACSRCGIDRPIKIGKIQRFVTDLEDKFEMKVMKKGASNGKKVALIGGGPGNLSCAAKLLEKGYEAEIFEANDKLGGYLRYGIPEYRLPEEIVDKEIAKIVDLGLVAHVNTKVGKDIEIETLKKDYDAVVIGVGFSAGKILPMFEGNKYTVTAIEFLEKLSKTKGETDLPKNAVVIGGGDVAMDVATSLKKLGCANVTDVIYEEAEEFVASKEELAGAREAGVTMMDGYVPEAIEGNKLTFKHRKLNSTVNIETELVVLAVGQKVENPLGLELTNNEVEFEGTHVKDTNIFVTGDIAKGDKTVVWAVEKGKKAAIAIEEYLGGENLD